MDSTPMISGRYLKQFLGQRVCLLGQVVQEVSPNAFQVRLSDNVDVTVHTPHGTEITTPYIEIMGRVASENSIDAMRVQSAGHNADFEIYNKMVELVNGPYRNLFA